MDSLISGALAGLSVDLLFFPLDTWKTRLQLSSALRTHLYRGLPIFLLGSAPSSAIFWSIYEPTKSQTHSTLGAALAAEIAASTIRVPIDAIKQNMQMNTYISTRKSIQIAWERKRGLYKGFQPNLLREVPFALIQYPLYEYLHTQSSIPRPFDGCIAGAIAGFLTTPLDVLRTRALSDTVNTSYLALMRTMRKAGISSCWKGAVPRVIWIGIGGGVYFEAYQRTKQWLQMDR